MSSNNILCNDTVYQVWAKSTGGLQENDYFYSGNKYTKTLDFRVASSCSSTYSWRRVWLTFYVATAWSFVLFVIHQRLSQDDSELSAVE
jgi:hypothetical protein